MQADVRCIPGHIMVVKLSFHHLQSWWNGESIENECECRKQKWREKKKKLGVGWGAVGLSLVLGRVLEEGKGEKQNGIWLSCIHSSFCFHSGWLCLPPPLNHNGHSLIILTVYLILLSSYIILLWYSCWSWVI